MSARWQVIHGDCREVLPTLGQVDHVITDPPYSRDLYLKFRSNKGARGVESKQTSNHLALANMAIGAVEDIHEVCSLEFVRLAKRWMIVFHDAETGHLWREGLGESYVRAGVWVKPNAVPQISGDRPGQGFEAITIGHAKGRKRWNGGGHSAVWVHCAVNANPIADDRACNPHPCPKPLSLMLELVELFTDPDDLVLDPFCGSGTTGVACLRLGRRFIGIEKDATYAAVARERLEAESKGLTLRDARAGQLPMFGGEP